MQEERVCVRWHAILASAFWAVTIAGCGLGDVGADLDAWRLAQAADADATADGDAIQPTDTGSDTAVADAADAGQVDVVGDGSDGASDADDTDDTVDTQDANDAGDVPVDVPWPCTPGSCDDGTPCTQDNCTASGCSHAPVGGPCDDKKACTDQDACKDGACTAGLPLVWTVTDVQKDVSELWMAARALPDGGYLLAGRMNEFGIEDGPAQGRMMRLDPHGQTVGAWTSDPAQDVRIAVAAARTDGATAILGRQMVDGELSMFYGVVPADAATPTSLSPLPGWPEEPMALVMAPGDVAVVLGRIISGTKPMQWVLDRIGADGKAISHTILQANSSYSGNALAMVGENAFVVGTRKEVGSLHSGWAQLFGADGKTIGPERIYTCTGGIDQSLAGVVAVPGGWVMAGMCNTPGATNIWLIGTDLQGKELWSKVTAGNAEEAFGISALADGGLIVVGNTIGKPIRPLVWKIDTLGQTIWHRAFDVVGVTVGAVQASDGGLLAFGAQTTDPTLAHLNGYALRLNAWGFTDCAAAGACAGGVSSCSDGNACTDDLCDAKTGCLFTVKPLTCEDGLVCTIGDQCTAGKCVAGPPDTCSDDVQCTDDLCSAVFGCKHNFANNGTVCTDGDACSEGDACKAGGVCEAKGLTNCDDGTTCTDDGCDKASGCSHVMVPFGSQCATGKYCSGAKCVIPWAQSLALGAEFACALRPDGTVECWGDNTFGQLGDGGASSTTLAKVVQVPPMVELAAGKEFACGLTKDGKVWCWGANGSGQAGADLTTKKAVVTLVALPYPALHVAAGDRHACATTEGAVYCWGNNEQNQLGFAKAASPTPSQVQGVYDAVVMAAGGDQTCAITGTQVTCWGRSTLALTGFVKSDGVESFELDAKALQLSASANHVCALMPDLTVRCWGMNLYGQLGIAKSGTTLGYGPQSAVPGLPEVAAIAVGNHHTCARDVDDKVWCWGLGTGKQLGDATLLPNPGSSLVPVLAVTPGARAIASRDQYNCIVSLVGAVACWGTYGPSASPVVASKPGYLPWSEP